MGLETLGSSRCPEEERLRLGLREPQLRSRRRRSSLRCDSALPCKDRCTRSARQDSKKGLRIFASRPEQRGRTSLRGSHRKSCRIEERFVAGSREENQQSHNRYLEGVARFRPHSSKWRIP